MGKKKVDNLQYLKDRSLRNIAYHIRKRGLLKKAIELSSMCGLEMFLLIYDKEKDKIIEYQSNDRFNLGKVTEIIEYSQKLKSKKKFHHLNFTNKDYYSFVTNQQKSHNKEEGVWFGPVSSEAISIESRKDNDDGNDRNSKSVDAARESKSNFNIQKSTRQRMIENSETSRNLNEQEVQHVSSKYQFDLKNPINQEENDECMQQEIDESYQLAQIIQIKQQQNFGLPAWDNQNITQPIKTQNNKPFQNEKGIPAKKSNYINQEITNQLNFVKRPYSQHSSKQPLQQLNSGSSNFIDMLLDPGNGTNSFNDILATNFENENPQLKKQLEKVTNNLRATLREKQFNSGKLFNAKSIGVVKTTQNLWQVASQDPLIQHGTKKQNQATSLDNVLANLKGFNKNNLDQVSYRLKEQLQTPDYQNQAQQAHQESIGNQNFGVSKHIPLEDTVKLPIGEIDKIISCINQRPLLQGDPELENKGFKPYFQFQFYSNQIELRHKKFNNN